MANQNRKLAVVVGCNYKTMGLFSELDGCHNDAFKIHQMLTTRFGYDPKTVVLMTDRDHADSPVMPTGKNIKDKLKTMIDASKAGDNLFFFFAGHGGIVQPRVKGRKPAQSITPCDGNAITSLDFRYLVNRLHKGASFTILADSYCSGGLIDKEPVQVGPPRILLQDQAAAADDEDEAAAPGDMNYRFVSYEVLLDKVSTLSGLNDPDLGVHMVNLFGSDASLMFRMLPANQRPTPLTPDQGILLSGCGPNGSTYEDPDENCGAFTKFVSQFFMKQKPETRKISNRKLILMARNFLGNPNRDGPPQFPCLYSSRKKADAPFLNYKPKAGRASDSSEEDEEEQPTTSSK
ncbi:hypothetical protein ACP275_11G021400 [Erythranthe tilingii]